MFDIIIKNAEVVNGTGSPAFRADIGVKDGRIAFIGTSDFHAERVIDASGAIAAPGFIDMHSHTDMTLFIDPRAQSKITQGITTELCGNCGFSSAPCLDESGRAEMASWRNKHDVTDDWTSLQEMLAALEQRQIGINFATLVGHSNLRASAVGLVNREATPEEIDEMKLHLSQALEEGAFGLSTGLIYPPSSYADTSELIELAAVTASHGKIYASHIRNEVDELVEAVDEAIRIGRESGASVQLSHHKACGRLNWGKVKTTLEMVQEARTEGVNVNVDQYPYIAGSASLKMMLPEWAHNGGDDAMLHRIRSQRNCLLEHLRSLSATGGGLANDGGWTSIVISSVRSDRNKSCEGSSILEIAELRNIEPAAVVLDLLSEERLSAGMIQFGQCEDNVKLVMQCAVAMVGTDASARSLDGELSKGKPHPRSFGTFPRILGQYVRKQKVIPLKLAIQKMTSLPARKLGITDRGELKVDNWADIVIFDPDKIEDAASYKNPHQVSQGISYVIVNGQVAVEHGELTGVLAGKVLRSKRL